MTNTEIRAWYLKEVRRMPELNRQWIEEGLTVEQRAEKAWRFRRHARLEARSMMSDPREVTLLRKRDQARYDDPDGPSFAWLVEKAGSQGLCGAAIYQAIIDGAYRTDEDTLPGSQPN